MVAGLGNPVGAVPLMDAGAPRIISGQVRNEIISGGVFVFGSGAADVISSGANSFVNSDLLFTRDASGGQFNGVCVQATAVSGAIAVATDGFFILLANGTVTAGVPQRCDGLNAVADVGSKTMAAFTQYEQMGRAVTAATSGGYAIVQITP